MQTCNNDKLFLLFLNARILVDAYRLGNRQAFNVGAGDAIVIQ